MTYKEYLALAIPFVLSTVTQPLLGAVDTAIIGRLDNASYIGGVAIGSTIFSTLYWLFGFLRVSTSGFSAQSLGSKDESDTYYAYFRPLVIAVIISLTFVLLQVFIRNGALYLYDPAPEVARHAATYFNILIWGAPFVLIGYVNLGWLMGRKYAKETLYLQVSTNVLNIVLDIIFVIILKLGVAGVAFGTLIAQVYGFIVGLLIIAKKLDLLKVVKYRAGILNKAAIKKIMGVNTDLMIRTICLLIMTNMFVAKGSDFGTVTLAANAVLFQIQYVLVYMFDGIANASSVFAGKSLAEKNLKEFKNVMSISNKFTIVISLILATLVFLLNDSLITIFTNLEDVIAVSQEYLIWIVIFPLVIGYGNVYYGIYTGCTFTKPIRNTMIMSLLMFLGAYFIAIPIYGNHGLWLAFILFSFGRSFTLYFYKNKLLNKLFD